MPDELIGTGEIKTKYDLDRVQVFRLIRAGDFPDPVAKLGGGRVWRADDIERAVMRLREVGRITRDYRLVPWRYLEHEKIEEPWRLDALEAR